MVAQLGSYEISAFLEIFGLYVSDEVRPKAVVAVSCAITIDNVMLIFDRVDRCE